jgi:diguanylate cyclase (GGDEF)-like protein
VKESLPRVLVLARSRAFRDAARGALRPEAFRARVMNGVSAAGVLRGVERHRPDAVLVEAPPAGGESAFALAENLVARGAGAVLLVSREADAAFRRRAKRSGAEAAAWAEDGPALAAAVESAARLERARRENRRLQREVELLRNVKSVAKILDAERLVMAMVDAAVELTGARIGAFVETKSAGKFAAREVRGFSRDKTKGGAFGLPHAALKRLLGKKSATLVRTGGTFRPSGVRVRSAAAVPVLAGKKKIGLLLVARGEEAAAFGADDLYILDTLVRESAEGVENALYHRRVQELTLRDDLTSAYNRRYFETCVEDEIRRAQRFKSQVTLIFLDLDNLRLINDRYGHFMGSHALMEAAHRMLDSIRGIDKLVRFGGDEFCVILPETDVEGARIVAERMLRRIAREPFIRDKVPGGAPLTVSIGIASFPEHALTKEDLIRRADEAMYRVKTHGKGSIAVARPLKPAKVSGAAA